MALSTYVPGGDWTPKQIDRWLVVQEGDLALRERQHEFARQKHEWELEREGKGGE